MVRNGRRTGHRTIDAQGSAAGLGRRLDDSARVRHVFSQLLHEIISGGKRDVRVQVANKVKLQALLVEVAFEIEEECLDAKLRTAERGPVADRKRGDELALISDRAPRICSKGRDQLVRLDADVGGRKP